MRRDRFEKLDGEIEREREKERPDRRRRKVEDGGGIADRINRTVGLT